MLLGATLNKHQKPLLRPAAHSQSLLKNQCSAHNVVLSSLPLKHPSRVDWTGYSSQQIHGFAYGLLGKDKLEQFDLLSRGCGKGRMGRSQSAVTARATQLTAPQVSLKQILLFPKATWVSLCSSRQKSQIKLWRKSKRFY